MDGSANRHDIDETDYDGKHGKRWYYRLYSSATGEWFWEPRVPTPAEVTASHVYRGVSWEPTSVTEAEWPPDGLRGPHPLRGTAITLAEDWFDSLL